MRNYNALSPSLYRTFKYAARIYLRGINRTLTQILRADKPPLIIKQKAIHRFYRKT